MHQRRAAAPARRPSAARLLAAIVLPHLVSAVHQRLLPQSLVTCSPATVPGSARCRAPAGGGGEGTVPSWAQPTKVCDVRAAPGSAAAPGCPPGTPCRPGPCRASPSAPPAPQRAAPSPQSVAFAARSAGLAGGAVLVRRRDREAGMRCCG